MQNKSDKCAILIILYHPNLVRLQKCIESLNVKDADIYFYMNSHLSEEVETYMGNFKNVYGCGDNVGIAKATNELINLTLRLGYSYCVISDQDTIYPDYYVKEMLSNRLVGSIKVPLWRRAGCGQLGGFYQLRDDRIIHCSDPLYGENVLYSIASGMFVDLKSIGDVRFDEKFFIDAVDTDFCLRIVSSGKKIVVNTNVVLDHQLGKDSVVIFDRFYTRREAFRDYYITRNLLLIAFRGKYGFKRTLVKRFFFMSAIKHLILSIITSETKLNHSKYQLKSVLHAVINRSGRFTL